jgi:FAD/FMN-containing dehydrogenase
MVAPALPAQQLLLEAASVRPRFHIADRIEKHHGRPPRERVVQDVEVPIERCAEFLDWFLSEVPIEPIWLCPVRLRDRCPLYQMPPDPPTSTSASGPPSPPVHRGSDEPADRTEGPELDGHKSLYSDAYYSQDEFKELYGGEDYRDVKQTYDPDSRFLDLYAKAVQRR